MIQHNGGFYKTEQCMLHPKKDKNFIRNDTNRVQ